MAIGRIGEETRTLGDGGSVSVVVMELPGADAKSRVEICPALGFNCYSWTLTRPEGEFALLYQSPDFFSGGPPTRTGIPILFPFPNRIRDGRFTWDGKEYQLSLNDSTKKNAIHGFACRRPWRIVDQGVSEQSAFVTAEFHGSRDAAECRSLWPADYLIRVTYRLSAAWKLRIEAQVTNPDRTPLPFGLGYHPYFQVTPGQSLVQAPARLQWELKDNLPTGKAVPPDAAHSLDGERPYQDLHLDDAYTGLPHEPRADGLCPRGLVRRGPVTLRMFASPDFRDLVLFTPPHREAFALEPYTCTTDAINLQQRGIDAGWRVLPPGRTWEGIVELMVE